MVWFQTNSQFIWPWAKNNPFTIAMIFGGFTTYFFIMGTGYVQSYFGVLWPGRFIGFSIGVLIFALLTWLVLGEGVNSSRLNLYIVTISIRFRSKGYIIRSN